jgi:ATP-dependent Lon protease
MKSGDSSREKIKHFLSSIKAPRLGGGCRLGSGKGGVEEFPFLPLKDIVLFPHTVIPLFVTQKPGIAAVEAALKRDLRLFAACVTGRDADRTGITGVVTRILQHIRLPDNTFRVVLQGEYRGVALSFVRGGSAPARGHSLVTAEPVRITGLSDPPDTKTLALMQAVRNSFAQYAEYSRRVSAETITAVERTDNPERLANLICNASVLKTAKKIELLGIADMTVRLETLLETLELENEIFGIQKNISGKVKSRMEKTQREYILHEQIKEINKELGKDPAEDEFAELEKSIAAKHPGEDVIDKSGN